MNDTTEYAIRIDREEGSEIDRRSITTDRKAIRQRKKLTIKSEDMYARAAGKKPAAVTVVMRTCTPWCEVCTDDPFKRKETT